MTLEELYQGSMRVVDEHARKKVMAAGNYAATLAEEDGPSVEELAEVLD
jgi:hypothetical protein